MNHVSVSPTHGNGPTQGQRKTLTRVGIEPTTFGRSPPLYRLSYKVRREQAVGTEDVKVTKDCSYDYKKAYDKVHHDWMLRVYTWIGIPGNVIAGLSELMRKWKTRLEIWKDDE